MMWLHCFTLITTFCSLAPAPTDIDAARAHLADAASETHALVCAIRPWNPEKWKYIAPLPMLECDRDHTLGYPLRKDVARYALCREWSIAHDPLPQSVGCAHRPPQWPTSTDAPALRELLRDQDPDIRGLAAEALATLHIAVDAALIGTLLDDHIPSMETLGYCRQLSPLALFDRMQDDETFDFLRSWHERTVSEHAQAALSLMTGRRFQSRDEFDSWWIRHGDADACVWNWDTRFNRQLASRLTALACELNRLEPPPYPFGERAGPEAIREAQQRFQIRLAALAASRISQRRDATIALRALSPDSEARIHLLALSAQMWDEALQDDSEMFPGARALRLPPERVLNLLNGRDLWDDIDTAEPQGREMRSCMTRRLLLAADVLLTPDHIPCLRELPALAVPLNHIAISRLQPPAASAQDLDDPSTREGILRAAIRADQQLQSIPLVVELLRVSPDRSGAFIRDHFFNLPRLRSQSNFRHTVLGELAKPPYTAERLNLLLNIVLDDRFVQDWKEPITDPGHGMDRQYAMWAINSHAGDDYITNADYNLLGESNTSAARWADVHRRLLLMREP